MAAQNQNGPNKSLYMYTSLIFVVAILLIILSFFAMSNRDNRMNETEQAQSITEKTAALSEENKNLAEENKTLKDSNRAMSAALLSIANEYYAAGDTAKAAEIAASVDVSSLTDEEKTVYTAITGTALPTAEPAAE